ncbi:hypothetical protein, partial [uncultured Dialister sp.]|uniref:hypothetical protein n=1 Tax=uncultured Dialister sp. TaxID=278064 RepID=UPI0025CE54CE
RVASFLALHKNSRIKANNDLISASLDSDLISASPGRIHIGERKKFLTGRKGVWNSYVNQN